MKTMLYKPEGKEVIWGIKCTSCTVDSDDVDELLKQGWYKTPLNFDKEVKKPKGNKAVKNGDSND